MVLKDTLRKNQEYYLLNSTKLREFKPKLYREVLFTNNILLDQLLLLKISKFNIKIWSLFTELLLSNTTLQSLILTLKPKLTIELSRFQSSMMLELKYQLFITFLNIMMFLFTSRCLLLRISSRETLRTSISILKIISKKKVEK